jgi:Ca2+-binding EF-hand superfamily protein
MIRRVSRADLGVKDQADSEEKDKQDIKNSSSASLLIPMLSKKPLLGDKRSTVVHTSEKFILNEENPNYQLPFVFTEDEIKDAFDTLDINKQKFITREEVSFFLDILGEQVSDAELDEMVRMLDIERTQKVYLKEFTRMAMGKSLSPIGIAYPPTLPMLEKQNINKLSNVDVASKIKSTGDQVAFIKNKGNDKDDGGFAAKKRAQIEKGGKDSNLQRKKEVDARERLIKNVMEETKLDIGKAITRMKLKKQREVKECSLKMFAHIIEQPEDNKIKLIYDSLCASGPPLIDVREFLTNCVAYNGWTNKEKAKVAFSIFDHENTNQIYFEDFVLAICVIRAN